MTKEHKTEGTKSWQLRQTRAAAEEIKEEQAEEGKEDAGETDV